MELVAALAPAGGTVIDYMCGTGSLLARIQLRRPDLRLLGCDISPLFVRFARDRRPHLSIHRCDALTFAPKQVPDIVLCTGGLHHLIEPLQAQMLVRLHETLPPNGLLLLGDEVFGPFVTSDERKVAAHALHCEIHEYFTTTSAPGHIIRAAEAVFEADLLRAGEYKQSKHALTNLIGSIFTIEEIVHVWPTAEPHHGDVIFSCRKST